MLVLRLFLILAGVAVASSLVVGFLLRDPRWFRFAWQILKFSLVLLLVVLALIAAGRLVLL
jgi:hypothetical protein